MLTFNFKRDFIEALDNIVCRLGQGAKICNCNCNADDRFIFACVEFVEEEISPVFLNNVPFFII
jgi:hypothetical protein